MKNLILLVLTFFFVTLAFGSGQTDYPFEVQKSGQGDQAMILIPGFSCSGEVWNETKATLPEHFTFYTLTMAGFAGVAPHPDSNFENWKIGIADYIINEKIDQPIIVGHSMGGGLAMALAADYPELIGKIVVVDALPCLMALSNPSFEQQENVDCSSSVEQITAMNDEQFRQMQFMSMPQMMQNADMMETVVNWSVKSDRETFAKMFCDFTNTDLRQRIEKIECPSFILLESPFKNFKEPIEAQYANLKTADLRYAEKGLHFIMYDDKEWYFNQLNDFLVEKL
ncbi:MAG: alpha/beta hydrolase [Bacteroidota bacterium]